MPDTAYVVRATMMMTRAELHALAKVAESLPDEPLLPGSSWSVQGIIQRVQLGLTSETDEPDVAQDARFASRVRPVSNSGAS